MNKNAKHNIVLGSLLILLSIGVLSVLLQSSSCVEAETDDRLIVDYEVAESSDISEGTAPRTIIYTPPPVRTTQSWEDAESQTISTVLASTVIIGASITGLCFIHHMRKNENNNSDGSLTNLQLNKTIWVLFGGIGILLLIFLISANSSATVYVVPDDYGSIQEAVDATVNGDEVHVKSDPGYDTTYYENVLIDTNIVLKRHAQSAHDVTIDGGSWSYVVKLNITDGAEVKGFRIKNADVGIFLNQTENTTLKNNVMTQCGIRLWGNFKEMWDTHTIDSSNTVNGYPVYYVKNYSDEGNRLYIPDDQGQVIIADSLNVTVSNQNYLNHNSVGIQVAFSPAGWDGQHGYNEECYLKIYDNNCSNNKFSGISLFYCCDVKVINNMCSNTSPKDEYDINYGIQVDHSVNCLISDNACDKKWDGIHIFASDECTVLNNECSGNMNNGIDLNYSDKTFIMDCTLEDNKCAGIMVEDSNQTIIAHNTITGNGDGQDEHWRIGGIYCHDNANDNIANYNIIQYNDYGIYVEEGSSIDAEYNYWGSADGPSPEGDGSTASGSGDSVTASADFEPWRCVAFDAFKAGHYPARDHTRVIFVDGSANDPEEDGTYDHPYNKIHEALYWQVAQETCIVFVFGCGTDYVSNKSAGQEIDFESRKICLMGEGPNDTKIVHGGGTDYHVVEILSKESTVIGFTISNSSTDYAGIWIGNGTDSLIVCNHIIDNYYGILIEPVESEHSTNVNDHTIMFNEIHDNTNYGVKILHDDPNDETNNNIIKFNVFKSNGGASSQAYDYDESDGNNWNNNFWSGHESGVYDIDSAIGDPKDYNPKFNENEAGFIYVEGTPES